MHCKIHVLLPPLQKLRTICEHMRSMSDVLAIHACHGDPELGGSLKLSVDSDEAHVETQWPNVKIPATGESWRLQASSAEGIAVIVNQPTQESQEREPPDPDQWFGVQLSMRAFLKFLSSHVVSSATIACESPILYHENGNVNA